MNSPVEKIKEKLSIVDVISSYITVLEAGKNYKARCPFHNEKTPSFFISPDRGTYYCFGCGSKGDIFSFVQQFEGIDFLGSLKLLATRAGVAIEDKRSLQSKDERERYYEIMEEATSFFENNLNKNIEAKAYLRNRGLSDETIKLFRIGYVEDVWRSVSDYLIKKGFKKDEIETVGLIKKSESGFYDRFRGRIIFPINDSSGRVIAFSGRIFGKSDKQEVQTDGSIVQAKYLNSPDTPLFNKSNVLFGIDKAKLPIRSRGYSIIVEGQMDLLLSHQYSFTNTVAVSGTALATNIVDNHRSDTSEESESKINNLGLIRRLSTNIIFAFDGDEAGIRAASRSSMIALSLDMQVKIAILPDGKDPADVILDNPDKWKDIIKNSVNIISFHIDRICKTSNDMRIRGKKIREIVFPFLLMIRSAIDRSAYINEIYKKTGLSEEAVNEDFLVYEKNNQTDKVEFNKVENKEKNSLSRRANLERRLFGIIFWQEQNNLHDSELEISINSFKKNINTKIFENMQDIYEQNRDTLAFEAEVWYGSKTQAINRDLNEITLNLEEEILNEEKLSLQPIDSEEKLARFDTISKRIEEIKKSRSL